jgi:hypothetical protein
MSLQINNHKNTVQEIVNKTQTSAVTYAIGQGTNWIVSWLCYLLGLLCFLLPFIMKNVFPFHVISKLDNSTNVIEAIGSKGDVQAFTFAVRALLVVIGILLFIVGNFVHSISKRNAVIKSSNTLANKLLKEMETSIAQSDLKANTLEGGAVLKPMEPKSFEGLDV